MKSTWFAAVASLLMMPQATVWAETAFVDVTATSGLGFVCAFGESIDGSIIQEMMFLNMGNGAAVGDYDDDGDLDVYVCGQWGDTNVLFRNELDLGSKTFTNVTPPTLADQGMSRLAFFADMDGDGLRDLVLVNDGIAPGAGPESTSQIWQGNGDGTFVSVTAGSGFAPDGMLHCGAAITDYDGDGDLDIYTTNWSMYGSAGPAQFPGSNRLFRNNGSFLFSDVTALSGLGVLAIDSFTPIFTDFDADLDQDIFVAIDHRKDRFYRRVGNFFSDVSAVVGVDHIGNDMGVAAADFDDDDDLDLYATNISDDDGIMGLGYGNVLYINQLTESGAATFVNEAASRGVEQTYWGWGTVFIDADNDTDLDIVAGTGFDTYVEFAVGPGSPVYQTPTVYLENDGTGHFTRVTPVGLEDGDDSRAVIAFDYDRDGDEDLLVTNINQSCRLYENVSTDQGHWLHVRLGPDADAAGAVVYATIGDRTLRRDVLFARSYVAGFPLEAHFGLGAATTVDELRVRWVDGSEDIYVDVSADQLLSFQRGLLAVDAPTSGAPVAVAAPHPNPTRTGTSFAYRVDVATRLEITIHDARGRLVRRIATTVDAGTGSIHWDGRLASGSAVLPGVYHYRAVGDGGIEVATGKVVIAR